MASCSATFDFRAAQSEFCGDVLITVERLLEGTTIMREQAASARHIHVELDRHDVIVAEDGNCSAFENSAAHIVLHPYFALASWDHAWTLRCTEVARRLRSGSFRMHERALEPGHCVEVAPICAYLPTPKWCR
jgi:hypothetical protein